MKKEELSIMMGAKSACNLTSKRPKLIQANLKSSNIRSQVKLKINKNQGKVFTNCTLTATNNKTAAQRQNRDTIKSMTKKMMNSVIVKLNDVSTPLSLRR